MSFQASSAAALAISALRRSSGSVCTTPPGTREPLTGQRYSASRRSERLPAGQEACGDVGFPAVGMGAQLSWPDVDDHGPRHLPPHVPRDMSRAVEICDAFRSSKTRMVSKVQYRAE
jgi:hypothetical protein